MKYNDWVLSETLNLKRCHSYHGYSIDADDLRVVSHRNRLPFSLQWGINFDYSRKINQSVGSQGYLISHIFLEKGNRRLIYIHHLIADAFHGPRPKGFETRHLDDNKLNNNPSNLCYGTVAENMADRRKNGIQSYGIACWNAKLTDDDVRKIRLLKSKGFRASEIIKITGIRQDTVSRILNKKIWAHVDMDINELKAITAPFSSDR